MKNYSLRKSQKKLEFVIISTAIVAIFLIVFIIIVVNNLLSWAPRLEQAIITVSLIGIPLLWILQLIGLYASWNATRYTISEDGIRISHKQGLMGRSSTVYRYESIISAELRQSYFGERYGYGDIYLTIPKLDKDVVLSSIDVPQLPMEYIQKRVANLKGNTQSLIN
jgi:membrane protein YdbS with pleckstrin-like domain